MEADESRRKLQRPSAGRIVCSTSKGFQASCGSRLAPNSRHQSTVASAKSWCAASSANSRKICILQVRSFKKILRVLLQRVHCVRVSLGIFITNLGALVLLSSREPGRKSFSLVRAHRRSISPLQGIRDLVIPGVVFASERSTRLQLPRSTGISDPVQAARLIGGNARVTFCF